MANMGTLDDLTGRVFGRLTVTSLTGRNRWGSILWTCSCSCGNSVVVLGSNLRKTKKGTVSCGCVWRCRRGLANTAEYGIWRLMLARCHQPRATNYCSYGGRGIGVCARWRDDFDAFLQDMGTRPSPEHTIERCDNDGDYTPDNCRWATQTEQARNKRSNRRLTYKGETLTCADWARRLGITRPALCTRLRTGWTVERALSTPHMNRGPGSVRTT